MSLSNPDSNKMKNICFILVSLLSMCACSSRKHEIQKNETKEIKSDSTKCVEPEWRPFETHFENTVASIHTQIKIFKNQGYLVWVTYEPIDSIDIKEVKCFCFDFDFIQFCVLARHKYQDKEAIESEEPSGLNWHFIVPDCEITVIIDELKNILEEHHPYNDAAYWKYFNKMYSGQNETDKIQDSDI